MILVADIHGAAEPLRRIAARPGQLLVLGDLINFIDYRTFEGIVADVCGREFVMEMVNLRTSGRFREASALWRTFRDGRETELSARYDELIDASYREVCGALEGSGAIVTFGNVDHPEILRRHLPGDCRFVESGVVEVDGMAVGIVGGGLTALGVPGEVPDEAMGERLHGLGAVDVLCTHVAPAVEPLSTDVIGGRPKGSVAVLEYLLEHQPLFHYFGDIHQPQAVCWTVGRTQCRNVGYFRATGRPVLHS